MATIHAAAFPAPDAWGPDVFSLHAGLPNVIGLLHADEALVLARFAAGEAEILTLAVVPSARRGGLATALLHEAFTRLAAAGASVVFLEASVENTAALALYFGTGFTEAGRRPNYYTDGTDAILLRLDVAEPV